jgi:hypothetical protein
MYHYLFTSDRIIAQVVSRQLLLAEVRIRSQDSPCGICGAQCHCDRFLSESFGFPRQYHSIAAPYSLMYHLGDGQWAH